MCNWYFLLQFSFKNFTSGFHSVLFVSHQNNATLCFSLYHIDKLQWSNSLSICKGEGERISTLSLQYKTMIFPGGTIKS